MVGLTGGVIISLAGLYPIVGLLAPLWLAGWERPFANELVHNVWLLGSAVLGVPVVLGLGFWAANRAQARGWQRGAQAGALAGATAGLLSYITLIIPTHALFTYSIFSTDLPAILNADAPLPSPELVGQYTQAFDDVAVQLELVLLVAALFWGLQGALLGWRRRDAPLPERPSLLTLLQAGQPLKKWFAEDDTAVQTGLAVGGILALLLSLMASGWSALMVVPDWPELAALIQQGQRGIISDLLGKAWPLPLAILLFGLISFGLITVYLLKNPPNRWRARLTAVLLAALTIATVATAIFLRFFYFSLGFSPLLAVRLLALDPVIVPETVPILQIIEATFKDPGSFMIGILATPWIALLLVGLVGALLGGVLAMLAVPTLMALRPCPVDRAATIQRRLRRQPNEVLPIIYALFGQTPLAYDILIHLAVQSQYNQPAVATLAAAYHTLGSSPRSDQYEPAAAAVAELLAAQRSWRWASDLGSAYQMLQELLPTRTLSEIVAISLPPSQDSASLPSPIVQNGRLVGRIVTELQKAERAEDLPAQLLFLESALTAVNEARAFVQTPPEQAARQQLQVPLPQQPVLAYVLDRWQVMVTAAVQRLRGRADVTLTLQTRHSGFVPELPLVYQVLNQGLNAARQVHVRLLPGDGYHLLGVKSEGLIETLLPEEQQELTLTVMPEPEQLRIRVSFELIFDDAMNAERRYVFADPVEFVRQERPFMRVFPIPYIIGRPLKSEGLFVGRSDVFHFIQKNLVESNQNNAIVLYGQRRMGKTSVLYQLKQVLAETHVAVLIDMQRKPAQGETNFLYAIAADIVFALQDAGLETELPPRSAFVEAPEFYFRSHFVRSLLPYLDGKNLLLLFDEYEELQRRVEDGRLQPEIFQFLHNLMHEGRIDLVLAGARKLEALGAEYWSVLSNAAIYHPITFLAAEELRRLIVDPVTAFNVDYDPLAIERIIAVTAGHPYFAQLLLHEMMVYQNEMEASYLTTVDVDQVIERIVQRGGGHFRFIWAESTEEEKLVLQAVAALSSGGEAMAVKEIRQFLSERGHAAQDRWQKALDSLTDRDILLGQNGKKPQYRFRIDLLRLWVDQTQPPL